MGLPIYTVWHQTKEYQMAAVSSKFSFVVPFNSVVRTTEPLKNIREVLYSHIKKVSLLVPELISGLLSKDLKDLTEAST